MDRRDFMKMCSVAGLGLVATGLPGTENEAHALTASEQLFVQVNASGGYDHTLLFTPKGNATNSGGYVVNRGYAAPAVSTTASNIDYAPDLVDAQMNYVNLIGPVKKTFFDTYGSMMTVIRGIDCQTNSHDGGQRNTWAGNQADGFPSFAALLAAATGYDKPLAFITNGGYSTTAGVIAPTRLGNTDALAPLIYPNRMDAEDADSELYMTDETFKRVLATRQERLNRAQQLQNLPKIKNAMSLLYTSRLGMGELKKIEDYLPPADQMGQGMARQANIALAAWLAGLTVSVTLSAGGFDTHGNNDQSAEQRFANYVSGTTALLQRAETLGVADRLVIAMGSDFGRTPDYNDADGKDHWSVGAMCVIGRGIEGNRVVGDTTDTLKYRNLNFDSLATDDSGDTLQNGHIHKWLRSYFGIENHEVVKTFALPNEGNIDLGMPG
jgi:hypothetical protein